jgi:hypothetical protein
MISEALKIPEAIDQYWQKRTHIRKCSPAAAEHIPASMRLSSGYRRNQRIASSPGPIFSACYELGTTTGLMTLTLPK